MTRRRLKLSELQSPARYAFVGGPFGSKLTTRDYVEQGVPVIRGVNLSGDARFNDGGYVYVSAEKARELESNMATRGDVVFTQRGTLGDVGIIPANAIHDRYVISQSQMKLSVDPCRADAAYVYYLFRSPAVISTILNSALSSGVPHINLTMLREFEVEVPDVAVQKRIASVLAAYDDLIENNTKRIGVLEEMARVLYRETFSCDEGTCESLLVSSLIERGVLEVGDGYRAKNTELGNPGIPFARAGDINGGFLFDEADRILDMNVPRAGRKVSEPGDIVFTSKGTVGRFAWVRETTQRFVYSPQLCFWRVLRPELLSARYVYRWMQTRAFLDQVDQVKGTTDMADYVSLSNQKRMRVTIPPIDRQRRYDELAGPIDELVGNLTDRTQRLRAARDLLLPKLLSGELSVDRIPDPAEVAP